MSLRKELLVTGYIRRIQTLLNSNQQIPIPIYDLCSSFHATFSLLLYRIFCKQRKQWELGIIDIETKHATLIDLGLLGGKKKSMHFAHCHIPNISSLIPNDMTHGHNELNGIIGNMYHKTYNHVTKKTTSFPHLILYKPKYNGSIHRIHPTYQYTSSKAIPNYPQQFLYCNPIQSVFYENKGDLFQFKLNEIKSKTDFFNSTLFNKIIQKEKKFNLEVTKTKIKYLKMQYLTANNAIFAIKNHDNDRRDMHCMMGQHKERTVECGLFHISNGEWSDISPFKYRKTDNFTEFKCVTCSNGNESVFMLTQKGDFAKYDLNKNEWKIIDTNAPRYAHRLTQTIWMEDELIYCYNVGKIYCFDLRDKSKQKWIECDWSVTNIPIDVQYYYILHFGCC